MDALDRDRLMAATGRPVVLLPSCDSTNRIAREQARALLTAVGGRRDRLPPALPLVVTEHQEAGRGRLGRSWQAEPGQNLLFTLLLAPDLALPQAPRAVLAWAAAMAQVLDVGLKWPNDLVDASDRKLGGLLAEHEPAGDGLGILCVGVGINVHQRDFPGLPDATSLARLRPGAAVDRNDLLADLVRAIDSVDLAAPDLLAPWRARSRTLGRTVRVDGRVGRATGLRDDGALLVDGQPVLAGDVELIAD